MGSKKIKDAWPIWVLVIAGIVIILFTVNQNKVEKEAVTFEDVFSSAAGKEGKSDPVQSPAIVANSDAGPRVMYAVQLYSFKEKSRADTMVSTLKSQGLSAYMQMSDLGDRGVWYRVRVGSYATADEAKAMLAQISKEHTGSILVKEKK